jgi:hypothetical protein
MIGYGGGSLSWGVDTVTANYVGVTVVGYSYLSTDFKSAYGTTTIGTNSVTNDAYLIGGDSGGGDFIYNSSTGKWDLAGINEAVDPSDNDSYMVQVSAYASQIDSDLAAVPEPNALLLILLVFPLLPALRRRVARV